MSIAALLGLGQYVRVRYDVGRLVGRVRTAMVDWTSIHTRWLVASHEQVEAEIEAARVAWPFEASVDPRRRTNGPLRVSSKNPRYFADRDGNVVYLAGSHTWLDFQDAGHGYPPPAFDYARYLRFLQAHHHNFMRMWVIEQARWSLETGDDQYFFSPMGPFRRTGPGKALDGLARWDLTQFDPTWFDRLRARVVAASERGIYVAVMLFNGWSVADRKGRFAENQPWRGHPFNSANNVNGIDGDPNGDGSGTETHELLDPRITRIQEAYVRKVVETLGDLDNVLWEISNESHAGSVAWQYHMIDSIKAWEATRPLRHPVGMSATFPGGGDDALFASNADWVSPAGYADPPAADGRKVVIADTDHIFGIGGDTQWAWKSFTQGLNVAFMDGYDGAAYGEGGAGFSLSAPRWVSLRRNIGYMRAVAEQMDLASMSPRGDLCAPSWCLASEPGGRAAYVAYAPQGGHVAVDLSAIRGALWAEWFDPRAATVVVADTVDAGAYRRFVPPFQGDAVLILNALDESR